METINSNNNIIDSDTQILEDIWNSIPESVLTAQLDASLTKTTELPKPVIKQQPPTLQRAAANPFTAGGKGKGKTVHRNNKVYIDGLQGINKPSIRRLARRGGVKRISETTYAESRLALKQFLAPVISNAIDYALHGHRKTVTAGDVIMALKRRQITMYGFK
jgi:histone H4